MASHSHGCLRATNCCHHRDLLCNVKCFEIIPAIRFYSTHLISLDSRNAKLVAVEESAKGCSEGHEMAPRVGVSR